MSAIEALESALNEARRPKDVLRSLLKKRGFSDLDEVFFAVNGKELDFDGFVRLLKPTDYVYLFVFETEHFDFPVVVKIGPRESESQAEKIAMVVYNTRLYTPRDRLLKTQVIPLGHMM